MKRVQTPLNLIQNRCKYPESLSTLTGCGYVQKRCAIAWNTNPKHYTSRSSLYTKHIAALVAALRLGRLIVPRRSLPLWGLSRIGMPLLRVALNASAHAGIMFQQAESPLRRHKALWSGPVGSLPHHDHHNHDVGTSEDTAPLVL